MGGKNAKPVSLLRQEGKKHLTKAEIAKREKSEIKLGDNNFICPEYVKRNIRAYEKWKEVIKIFKETDFVTSSDIGFIARYCRAYAEYLDLLDFVDSIQDQNSKAQFDTTINKKTELLIKMEDRLFLNPLSKIKSIPKSEPPKESDPNAAMFGD